MDIKKILRKSLLKEDLEMNKNHMEKTENFPMDMANGTEHGERKRTVNKLAVANFEKGFNEKYKNTTIETTDGEYIFHSVKLLNNYGWYGMWFIQDSVQEYENGRQYHQDKHILIKSDVGEVENYFSNDKIEVDVNSKEILAQMLSYNN